jgi:hypothetical protein
VLGAMDAATCTETRAKSKPNEEQARREACRGCIGLADPLDNEDHCAGNGPWTIPNGHLMCHDFSVFVQPVKGSRFLVQGSEAHPFVETANGFEQSYEMRGEGGRSFATLEAMGQKPDANGCVRDVEAEVELYFPEHCMAGEAMAHVRGPLVTTYWDDTGRGLLEVSAWKEKPTVTIRGKTALIEGAGCSETVTIAP